MSSEKNNKRKNEEKKDIVSKETKKKNNTNSNIKKEKNNQKEKSKGNQKTTNKKTTIQTTTSSSKKKRKRKRTNSSSVKPTTNLKEVKTTKTSSSKKKVTSSNQPKAKDNTKKISASNIKKQEKEKISTSKVTKTKKKTESKKVESKELNKEHLVIAVKDNKFKNKDRLVIAIKDRKEPKKLETKIEPKKKFNHVAFTIISLITIVLIIIFVMSFFINKNISIKLNGSTNEVIEVYSDYNDPGYNATLFKKNINKYIKIKSNLNTNKLGTYTIKYKLSFLNTHNTTRTIYVVDTTAPEIKLNGSKTLTMYVDEDYTEKGVTITDNYDKDLSNNLIIESNLDTNTKGTYTIKYTVKDSSNNESSITRTITVKNKPTNNKTCNVTNPISKYICENNYKVSVGYYNLNTEQTYYYNKYEQYYGASLIKTLDALYLYDKNMINDELKSHVKKIITVSDNPSHQYLVNYIGKNNLKAYGNSLGAKYTLIGGDNFGITTVSDQIVYMKKLYSMTNNNQNDELKSYFINSYYNNLLFDNCPTIMHKYGWWEQVFHNSGIVLDENPYIVTILTKEAYNDYNKIISTISKLVYDYHKTL